MPKSRAERWAAWGLEEALALYPGLAVRPVGGDKLCLSGELRFQAKQGEHNVVDAFDVKIIFPAQFPAQVPTAVETGGRIPKTFHTNPDGTLCLGSPLRVKLEVARDPSIQGFIERLVVPYLFNFVIGKLTGILPIGELEHGNPGVFADYRKLFGVRSSRACLAFVHLLTLKKRIANKFPCPCGSGHRVGRCHNRKLNALRRVASRAWFERERSELRR